MAGRRVTAAFRPGAGAQRLLRCQPARDLLAPGGGIARPVDGQGKQIETFGLAVGDGRRGIDSGDRRPQLLDLELIGGRSHEIGLGEEDSVGEGDLHGGLEMPFDGPVSRNGVCECDHAREGERADTFRLRRTGVEPLVD